MSGMRWKDDCPKWMPELSWVRILFLRQSDGVLRHKEGTQKALCFCAKMKTLMKPVRMLAWSTRDGIVTPLRFLWKDGKRTRNIRIHRIVERYEDKFAGNRMLGFRCQEWIDGEEKVFELKFEVKTCIWYLYKI